LASHETEKPAGPKKKRNEASLKEDTNMDDRTRQTALHETELTNYFAQDFAERTNALHKPTPVSLLIRPKSSGTLGKPVLRLHSARRPDPRIKSAARYAAEAVRPRKPRGKPQETLPR
jgi:hypothetical protein